MIMKMPMSTLPNARRSIVLLAAALLLPMAGTATAAGPTVVQSTTDYARVVRVMPIRGPETARQVCQPVSVERRSEHSPGGAILGGLAGAAVGSRFGGGHGRDALTVMGAIGGAMVGDRVGRGTQAETREVCDTVYERGEPVGYDVTYDYRGERHTVTLDYDPGERVRIRKTITVE